MARRPTRALPTHLDTPAGIVTPSGVRFRTTEALLNEWAGPVFEAEPVGELVRRAEGWVRAPATLTLIALPFLLLVLPTGWAALLGLLLYVVAALVLPAGPRPGLARLFALLDKPLVQAVLYVVVLSGMGMDGRIGAVAVGLVGFVGLRLGAVQRLLEPLLAPVWARLYPLPPADQVLRAIVVESAVRHGVALPELDRLQASARAAWGRGGGDGR